MVARSVRASQPEALILALAGGKLEAFEGDGRVPVADGIKNPGELAGRLETLAETFRTRERERRYLQTFRERNYEFLRRYASLKVKVDRSLGG